MKKSALVSTIVMIVVIVCCITAVTFSFFSTQSSNNIFELGSKVSEKFVVSFSEQGNQTISGDATKTDGTFESSGKVARLILTYESTKTSYANMYFTVSNLQYKVPSSAVVLAASGTTIVDPSSMNAAYMDSVIEFAFVKVPNGQTASDVDPPDEDSGWHVKRELSTDCFNLGEISQGASGTIVLFLRINTDNELLPPAMNEIEVIATIESSEL